MEEFVKELQTQLEISLNAISAETNPVRGCDKKIELIEIAIGRMKEYLLEHPFCNRECEIQYFKYWSLKLVKLDVYHVALYNLEITRITSDKDQLLRYMENEMRRIKAFTEEHQELYRYYRAGRTDEDERYFTFKLPSRTTAFLIADSTFCRASLVLGKLLAYEEYRVVLEDEIGRLKNPNLQGKKIEIRVPKSAVAEIIVPIFVLQWIWIDGQPATLNELVKMAEKGLQIDFKKILML